VAERSMMLTHPNRKPGLSAFKLLEMERGMIVIPAPKAVTLDR
jgi:hypothetical protein